MKYLIVITSILFSMSVAASECGKVVTNSEVQKSELEVITEVPEHLKGATITLLKANGTQEILKAEEYMIVKRKHTRPVLREKVSTTSVLCKNESVKNIASIKAVNSYGRSDTSIEGSTGTLNSSKRVTVGGQYQRNVGKDVFIGVDADLNKNAGLSIGIGF